MGDELRFTRDFHLLVITIKLSINLISLMFTINPFCIKMAHRNVIFFVGLIKLILLRLCVQLAQQQLKSFTHVNLSDGKPEFPSNK